MKRSDFLKGVGLLGAGAAIPFKSALAQGAALGAKGSATCVVIPTETEGPFPLDLTTNNSATYFRQDVREDRTGTLLHLKLKIIGHDNCLPMQNVRVNIWHCDKDGAYSGYTTAQGNTANTTGLTWLRGYQMADANGEVEFTTIFPGWYSGRLCHIHFQVYVSSIYQAVSQLTFPIAAKNALYAASPSLYTKGADPLTFSTDNIFSDGVTYQTATLTANTDGSYDAYLEVAVNGSGASTGVRNYEGETGGHFKMGQNFPNPYQDATTVPFTLNTQSDVQLDIYDLSARKVATIRPGALTAGDHTIPVDCAALGIPSGNYIYQLQVSNDAGVFRQCKMMTAIR